MVRHVTMQQRPQETLRQLCEIFPDFDEWWKIRESPSPEDGFVDGVFYQWTHHRVMQEFLMYFARSIHSLLRGSSGDLAIGLAKQQSPSIATLRTLSQPAFLNTCVR